MRVLETGEAAVSAKSLSKLLSLGARRGQTLEFIAEPTIAADALPALIAAVEQGLGEEVEPLPAVSEPQAAPTPAAVAKPLNAPAPGSVLQAVSASPGIAVGPAHVQVLRLPAKRANRLRPNVSVCTAPLAKCAATSKT